jgi:predicted nucleic acid-binding protein
MLDTGVLGAICHPRRYAEVKLWFRGVVGVGGHDVFLPEVADFELRRELLRLGSTASLRELDRLPSEVAYVPIDTAMMRDAAALWAALWNAGQPVGSADALGADVLLAAQARAVGATMVTDNPGHLGRMVSVIGWEEVGS